MSSGCLPTENAILPMVDKTEPSSNEIFTMFGRPFNAETPTDLTVFGITNSVKRLRSSVDESLNDILQLEGKSFRLFLIFDSNALTIEAEEAFIGEMVPFDNPDTAYDPFGFIGFIGENDNFTLELFISGSSSDMLSCTFPGTFRTPSLQPEQ